MEDITLRAVEPGRTEVLVNGRQIGDVRRERYGWFGYLPDHSRPATHARATRRAAATDLARAVRTSTGDPPNGP